MPKPLIDTPVPEPTTPDTAPPNWERVERERLTRRAALRKMGYTSGIALFSMFAVDDLARMAMKQMEQHKETRQIAETIAEEFKNAGIAFASPQSSGPCGSSPYYPPGTLGGDNIGRDCAYDQNFFCNDAVSFDACVRSACVHYSAVSDVDDCVNRANVHRPLPPPPNPWQP